MQNFFKVRPFKKDPHKKLKETGKQIEENKKQADILQEKKRDLKDLREKTGPMVEKLLAEEKELAAKLQEASNRLTEEQIAHESCNRNLEISRINLTNLQELIRKDESNETILKDVIRNNRKMAENNQKIIDEKEKINKCWDAIEELKQGNFSIKKESNVALSSIS